MKLTPDQIDALAEVVNIGVGRAAASLSQLTGERIELNVPSVSVCGADDLAQNLKTGNEAINLAIAQDMVGGLSGRALLAFPRSSGIKLGQLLGNIDSPTDELEEDLIGILEEVGNIVLNGVLGTIGNITETPLDYSVPVLSHDMEVHQLVTRHLLQSHASSGQHFVVLANTHFRVASRDIDGSLILVFDIHSLDAILKSLLGNATTCR